MRYWKNAKLNLKEFNLTNTGCDKVGLALTKSLWSAISSCASYDYTEAMTGSIVYIEFFNQLIFEIDLNSTRKFHAVDIDYRSILCKFIPASLPRI